MENEPAFKVVPHTGTRKGKLVDTGLDAVVYKQSDWPEHRRVALAERFPGAPLIMLEFMSEVEIAEACDALKARLCDGETTREIVKPKSLEK